MPTATAPVDLLVIGAHPDDVELTSVGLLLKAKQLGYRTAAIDMTRGEMGTRGTIESRQAELDRATAILKLDDRVNLGLPDGGVVPHPVAVEKVVRELRRLQPRLVVIPPKEDDDHPDHFYTSRIAWEAIHFANKPKYLPNVPYTTRIKRVLYSMYRRLFIPHFVIDMTDVMPEALKCVGVFESQFGTDGKDKDAPATMISNPAFLEWWKARRAMWGSQIGVPFGEPYQVHGMLRLDNPLAGL